MISNHRGRLARDGRTNPLEGLPWLIERPSIANEIGEEEIPETRRSPIWSFETSAGEPASAPAEAGASSQALVETMLEEAERWLSENWGRPSPRLLGGVLTQFPRFMAAIEACVERDETGARAFRLLLPCWGAVFNGRAHELSSSCDRVFERWPAGTEPWRPVASAIGASAHLVAGHLDTAAELAADGIERGADSALAQLVAWRVLGHTAQRRDQPEAAAEYFRRAVVVALESDLAAFERDLAALLASAKRPGSTPALRERRVSTRAPYR